MAVSIIIPTFTNYDGFKKIINELKFSKNEIIVIDNEYHSNKQKLIQKNINIKYFQQKENVGFAKACNLGAKIAKNKFLFFINDDCLISRSSIKKMERFLNDNPQFIATQPIIYNKKQIENIGHVVDLYKLKGDRINRTEYFKKINLTEIENNIFKNRYFYSLVGTCLMIDKNIFIKEGMFDETFHSYHEDIDFFIRLAKKGYQYFPLLNIKCLHEHMVTSSKMGSYKEKRDLINQIKIIIKNYPKIYILKHFITLFIERLRNISGYLKATFR